MIYVSTVPRARCGLSRQERSRCGPTRTAQRLPGAHLRVALIGAALAIIGASNMPAAYGARSIVRSIATRTVVPVGFQECQPVVGREWVWPPNNYAGSDLYKAKISSDLYESFVIDYTCARARAETQKLISEILPNTSPGSQNGFHIDGFSCVAFPDASGYAYGGECTSGLVRFAWNYNVIWQGVPGSSGGEAGAGFEPMGSIEYDTVLTPLGNGHYQLVVSDASAIGSIDAFTWSAPPQLTITAVTGSSKGHCQLAGGAVSCQGRLAAPQCLCTGSGGSVTIYFNATGATPTTHNGHVVNEGMSASYLNITQMTPVPRLIPDTPPTNGQL